MFINESLDTMNYKNWNNPKAWFEFINQMEFLKLEDIYSDLRIHNWKKLLGGKKSN